MPNNIVVPGYAKKIFYADGIEYRPFSPDLVGNQLTSNGGLSLFTLNNFYITTNLDPKLSYNFNLGKFSKYYNLSDIGYNENTELSYIYDSDGNSILKLDKTDLLTYAYFGSLSEFIRVEIESIIKKWPASLYMSPIYTTNSGEEEVVFTLVNYTYDQVSDSASFYVPSKAINNPFGINYLVNGTIDNTDNENNPMRNIVVNYLSYSVLYNNNEYNILDYSGVTTTATSDYMYVKVSGDPFTTTGTSSSQYVKYHIKPNAYICTEFFANLDEFSANLLNEFALPRYTSVFKWTQDSDSGNLVTFTKTITWPTTDGYNIDINTSYYEQYIRSILDISDILDSERSDLIVRFLVSDSIVDFDTSANYYSINNPDNYDQKIGKLLHVYGRSFDDIKRYIDGISLANVVTYDGLNNTPNSVLKNLAYVLGWDLTSSISDNQILSEYMARPRNSYSGYTRGYSQIEAEYELWRRLILNTAWVWKSKGHRKVIEFMIKFIGAPSGLMAINEHVYVADNPLDYDLVRRVAEENGIDMDVTALNIDTNGYPNAPTDTDDMYYQKGGGWYRETGGDNAATYILRGNNPHVGPYDSGREYIDRFRYLIPGFQPTTIVNEVIDNYQQELFTNYNQGTFNNIPLSSQTYVDLSSEGFDINDCVVVDSYLIVDPKPTNEITDCGCDIATNDQSMQIDVLFSSSTQPINCEDIFYLGESASPYNNNGFVEPGSGANTDPFFVYQYPQYQYGSSSYYSSPYYNSPFVNKTCCTGYTNGYPMEYTDINIYAPDGTYTQPTIDAFLGGFSGFTTGYICCKYDSGAVSNECVTRVTCKWRLANSYPDADNPYYPSFAQATIEIDGDRYLLFVKPNNQFAVTTPTGSNCVAPSVPTLVIDPYTGESGFGCKIDSSEWVLQIPYTYNDRFLGSIPCSGVSDGTEDTNETE